MLTYYLNIKFINLKQGEEHALLILSIIGLGTHFQQSKVTSFFMSIYNLP